MMKHNILGIKTGNGFNNKELVEYSENHMIFGKLHLESHRDHFSPMNKSSSLMQNFRLTLHIYIHKKKLYPRFSKM